jgi:hypothetical protein
VHLWSLDGPAPGELNAGVLDAAQIGGSLSVLHLVQAMFAANQGWILRFGLSPAARNRPAGIGRSFLWSKRR